MCITVPLCVQVHVLLITVAVMANHGCDRNRDSDVTSLFLIKWGGKIDTLSSTQTKLSRPLVVTSIHLSGYIDASNPVIPGTIQHLAASCHYYLSAEHTGRCFVTLMRHEQNLRAEKFNLIKAQDFLRNGSAYFRVVPLATMFCLTPSS